MLDLYGTTVSSRLLLGTARYPSPAILADAVCASDAQIVTVSLRRETAGGKAGGAFFAGSSLPKIASLIEPKIPMTSSCGYSRQVCRTLTESFAHTAVPHGHNPV